MLSVFSTDAYEEAGGAAVWRVTDRFAIEAGGWIQLYDERQRGARGETSVHLVPGAGRRTTVRVGYSRVLALGNGYHALRASLARRIVPALSATIEAYGYLYDEAIHGRTTSAVYSGTLSFQATRALCVLWGASLAQSPYARLDAQALVRASLSFDSSTRSAER